MGRHLFFVLLCSTALSAEAGCSGSIGHSSNASIVNTLNLSKIYQGSGISVQGSLAYISTAAIGNQSGARSLVIANLAAPAAPTILSTTSSGLASDMAGIAVSGSFAYVPFQSTAGTNFQVWNVASATGPSVVGSASISCPAGMFPFRSPAVYENYLYVACWESEVTTTGAFEILDVSNPASPSVIGSVAVTAGYQPVSIAVSGRYLYVVATQGGSTNDFVLLYSVENPASPSLVATVPTAHSPQWVAATGTAAVAAVYDAEELEVTDFSNPSDPRSYTANLGSCRPMSVAIDQDLALAPCDQPGGVAVVNVATISNPLSLGTVLSGTVLNVVAPSGNELYGIDESGNLETIDFSAPGN